MIVTMRQGIRPLCTTHHQPMNLAQFGEPTAFQVTTYKCDEAGCTRTYNTSMGYFDIVNNQYKRDDVQRNCPRDQTPMFLEESQGTGGIWNCGQIACDYRQKILAASVKLDSVPLWPDGILHVSGIPTNLTVNKTPAGEYQVVRVLKPGDPKEGEFDILFASQSEQECRAFQRQQVGIDFPGLL